MVKIDLPITPEMLKVAKMLNQEQLKNALITLINNNIGIIYEKIKGMS